MKEGIVFMINLSIPLGLRLSNFFCQNYRLFLSFSAKAFCMVIILSAFLSYLPFIFGFMSLGFSTGSFKL